MRSVGEFFETGYALRFLALCTGTLVLIHMTGTKEFIEAFYSPLLARLASGMLGWIGIEGAVSHATLVLPNGSMEVAWFCNGVDVMVLLACAIGAKTRVSPFRKIGWIASSLFMTLAINLARIVALGWVLQNVPNLFERAHDTLSSLALFLLSLFFMLFLVTEERASFQAPQKS